MTGYHLRRRRPSLYCYILAKLLALAAVSLDASKAENIMKPVEKQITHGAGGKILTNTGVWSLDGGWIVYDTRSDPAGEVFDGLTIDMVNIRTSEVKELYHSINGARCGVASFNPRRNQIVFILGPENPTLDWSYGPFHRQGVVLDLEKLQRTAHGVVVNLDARDLTPPFTPGALRGGTHLQVWDGAGEWVAFTYEDHLLAQFEKESPTNEVNLRNVGVCVPGRPVRVPKDHPRNHDGEYFSVIVTRTVANPRPGSDEIKRASEEAWVGTNGYVRPDGTRQHRALAFQGRLAGVNNETNSEVFIVDLPEDVTLAGDGPLAGTAGRMPFPPKGATQRRLTHTMGRKFPGLQGPRHWLRSSPDGSRIAFLMKDETGVVQLWTISPNGGEPSRITHNELPVSSTFTWRPDGRHLAHTMDNSVCITEVDSGITTRLTPRCDDAVAPRPEACVFSPDGSRIAFVRRLASAGRYANQICVVSFKP